MSRLTSAFGFISRPFSIKFGLSRKNTSQRKKIHKSCEFISYTQSNTHLFDSSMHIFAESNVYTMNFSQKKNHFFLFFYVERNLSEKERENFFSWNALTLFRMKKKLYGNLFAFERKIWRMSSVQFAHYFLGGHGVLSESLSSTEKK